MLAALTRRRPTTRAAAATPASTGGRRRRSIGSLAWYMMAATGLLALLVVVLLPWARGGPDQQLQQLWTGWSGIDAAAARPTCGRTDLPVIFYHIGKTGGGTVRALMKEHTPPGLPLCWQCTNIAKGGQFCAAERYQDLAAQCGAVARRQNPGTGDAATAWERGVVLGHYDLGWEYAFRPYPKGGDENREGLRVPAGGDGVLRVTLLREPVARTRSEFLFQWQTLAATDPEAVVGKFLPHLEGYDETAWRFIAGKAGVDASSGAADCLKGLSVTVLRLCGQPCWRRALDCQMTPAEALALAVENVRTRFDVVGTTEEMGTFFQMVARRAAPLASLAGADPGAVALHKGDEEVSRQLKVVLETPEARAAVARSKVLAAERVLYEAAVETMAAQWEALKDCPVVPVAASPAAAASLA